LRLKSRKELLTLLYRKLLILRIYSVLFDGIKKLPAEYTDAPGITHLFFYFAKDSKKAIPYFMLDKKVWEKLQLCIMSIA
jgi:hypothetical protein